MDRDRIIADLMQAGFSRENAERIADGDLEGFGPQTLNSEAVQAALETPLVQERVEARRGDVEGATGATRQTVISELMAAGLGRQKAEMLADGQLGEFGPFTLNDPDVRAALSSGGIGEPSKNWIERNLGPTVMAGVDFWGDTLGITGDDGPDTLDPELVARASQGDPDAMAEVEASGQVDAIAEIRRNAAKRQEAEALAIISDQLNYEVTDIDQVNEWIQEYNRSALDQITLGDLEGFMQRMDDPDMQYALQDSVLGTNDDVRRVRVGLTGRAQDDYTYFDQQEQQLVSDLGLTQREIGLAALGQKKFNLDLTESAAVASTINSLSSDEGRDENLKISQLEAEIRRVRAEREAKMGQPSQNGVAQLPNIGELQGLRAEEARLQNELGILNQSRAQREAFAQRTATGSFEKYIQISEQYNGNGTLGIIGLFDEDLAAKIYNGGGYDLTTEERRRARDIFDDAGNVRMPNSTDEQINAILYGNPTGAGPQKITYTAPDDSTLRESHRALYQSWFFDDPDDEALDAFVQNIQGQVRSEAMKQATSNRVNVFKQEFGSQAPVVVGLEDVDYARQQREDLRGTANYADLYSKRPAGVSEEQYAGVFAGTATDLLGREGALATDQIKQGMRSGDTGAVARLSFYDKKYRDNSTLLGRMAGAASSFAQFT